LWRSYSISKGVALEEEEARVAVVAVIIRQ
jgi:hypothetical protein